MASGIVPRSHAGGDFCFTERGSGRRDVFVHTKNIAAQDLCALQEPEDVGFGIALNRRRARWRLGPRLALEREATCVSPR
ncbi:cold shock domain-containing protein [Streptomyces sp. H62]